MKIVIKTKNIKLTPDLQEKIFDKIGSLERFAEVFQNEKHDSHFEGKGKPRAEAWVEVGKESLHHQKGNIFRAECQMHFSGKSIRSEATAETLDLAIVQVKDELQIILKKYKERMAALTKRRMRTAQKELKIAKEARFLRKGRIREEGL